MSYLWTYNCLQLQLRSYNCTITQSHVCTRTRPLKTPESKDGGLRVQAVLYQLLESFGIVRLETIIQIL